MRQSVLRRSGPTRIIAVACARQVALRRAGLLGSGRRAGPDATRGFVTDCWPSPWQSRAACTGTTGPSRWIRTSSSRRRSFRTISASSWPPASLPSSIRSASPSTPTAGCTWLRWAATRCGRPDRRRWAGSSGWSTPTSTATTRPGRCSPTSLPYPTSVLPWRDGVLVTAPPDIVPSARPRRRRRRRHTRTAVLGVPGCQHPAQHQRAHLGPRQLGLTLPTAAITAAGILPTRPTPSCRSAAWTSGSSRTPAPSRRRTRRPGGHGIAFDAWGRMFGTHNLNHVQHMVFPIRLPRGGTRCWLVLPTTRHMISNHGSSAQPVPTLRCRDPRQSIRNSPGTFLGRLGASPSTVGARWGQPTTASLFVNDVVVNVVHQDVLTARRPELRCYPPRRGRRAARRTR